MTGGLSARDAQMTFRPGDADSGPHARATQSATNTIRRIRKLFICNTYLPATSKLATAFAPVTVCSTTTV